jgi:hypothetical protein
MERYIQQLIEMLRTAKTKPLTPPYTDPLPEEYDCPELRGTEEYLAGEQGTFETYFNIKRNEFPPDTKLTDAQMEVLVTEMLDLLAVHHYVADLPEDITPRDAYNALLRQWTQQHCCVSCGNVHLEFYEDPELASYYEEFHKEMAKWESEYEERQKTGGDKSD